MADVAMPKKRQFFGLPVSWAGWTSIVAAILGAAGILSRRIVGGFRGVFALWIAAGVVALVAVLWKKERSLLVWVPLVVGVLAAVVVAAEFAFPH